MEHRHPVELPNTVASGGGLDRAALRGHPEDELHTRAEVTAGKGSWVDDNGTDVVRPS